MHEAATGLSQLRAEERRAAAGSRRLIGRPGLPASADQLHGRRGEPRLLLPSPAATGETTHTHTLNADKLKAASSSPRAFVEEEQIFGLIKVFAALTQNDISHCIIYY